ncbi:hypothetical protein D3C84_752320 [compost metagenome]
MCDFPRIELGLQALNFGILDSSGTLQVAQAFLFGPLSCGFLLVLCPLQRTRQCVAILFNNIQCLAHGELLSYLAGIELGFQLLEFRILGGGGFLQLVQEFCLSQLSGRFLFLRALLQGICQRIAILFYG